VVESDAPVATPDPVEDIRSGLALRVVPNPVGPTGTRLSFRLPAPERAQLWVVDVQGRVVRRFTQTAARAGDGEFWWDGRDESGRALPSGVYLARLRANTSTASTRLILLQR
jgi:hypothetical protein